MADPRVESVRWPLAGGAVVLHCENRIAAGIFKCHEVSNAGDRRLFHQHLPSSGKDRVADSVDVVDPDGGFKAKRWCAVEQVSTLLDSAHWPLATFVEDLHKARSILTKLPAKH